MFILMLLWELVYQRKEAQHCDIVIFFVMQMLQFLLKNKATKNNRR